MSVKEEFEKLKGTGSANIEKVAGEFNGVASDLLTKAINDIKNGKIQIRDTTDLEKVYRIFKDVNEITDGLSGEGGEGALPELNAGQEHVIEQRVKVHVATDTNSDGSITQKKTIKLSDIADMSAEDVGKLIQDKEKEQNNENAKDIL